MHPCECFLTDGVKEIAWLPLRVRLVLIHASISAIGFNRRPVGTDGQWGWA